MQECQEPGSQVSEIEAWQHAHRGRKWFRSIAATVPIRACRHTVRCTGRATRTRLVMCRSSLIRWWSWRSEEGIKVAPTTFLMTQYPHFLIPSYLSFGRRARAQGHPYVVARRLVSLNLHNSRFVAFIHPPMSLHSSNFNFYLRLWWHIIGRHGGRKESKAGSQGCTGDRAARRKEAKAGSRGRTSSIVVARKGCKRYSKHISGQYLAAWKLWRLLLHNSDVAWTCNVNLRELWTSLNYELLLWYINGIKLVMDKALACSKLGKIIFCSASNSAKGPPRWFLARCLLRTYWKISTKLDTWCPLVNPNFPTLEK